MTNPEAPKSRAEVKAEAKHDPTASLRRVLEQKKAEVARLTADRDAALVQVAAVAALADRLSAEPPGSTYGAVTIASHIRAALTDPATVLARRDAEKWDEDQELARQILDDYFGTNNEKNPYRIEKGERG